MFPNEKKYKKERNSSGLKRKKKKETEVKGE